MANTKVTQHVIANNAITADQLASAAVTPAKLHGTLDLSGKTLTLPATAIPSASTATTQSASDNSTKIATTAYVTTALANLVDSSPSSLNTLNELAAALNDDASFSTTVTNSLATKAPINNPTFTGSISHASDLTLDVAGNINLDADGGSIFFKDAGTEFFKVRKVGTTHVQLYSAQNNVDIKFEGVDAGVGFAALTLDMSEAGFATFNDGGTFGGTGAIRIPQGTTGQRPTAATGQIRWNTTDGALEVYNGTAWTAVGTGSSNKVLDTFTGDGSNRTFTLSVTPANEDAIMVFIDGAYQEKADYVLTNNSLVLDTAPLNNEKIAVHITTAAVHDGTSAVNQQFTATAGQTDFTLSQDPSSENNTQVYINGVYQQKTDYTVTGTTLAFDTGLTVGDVVEVNMFTVATLGNTDTVTEGVGNLYHTTARARGAISVSGNALSYNSSTGVITANFEENPVFTGTVGMANGYATTKFAVGVTGVHGSYDFYNNGTTYLNGASTVDDALTINGNTTIRSGNKLIINRTDNATGGEITYGPSSGTGFIFNDANSDGIDFKTGSTMLMSIDSTNQKVGIGTDSPQRELHVRNSSSGATSTSNSVAVFEGNDNTEVSILGGSSSVLALNFGHSGDNNEGMLYFNTTTGSENLQLESTKDITFRTTSTNSTAGDINFKSYNTTIMHIDGGNNRVGINVEKSGNSLPQKTFHVEHAAGASEGILISGASDTTGHTAGILLRAEGGEADSALRAKGAIFFERTGTYGVGKLHLANNIAADNNSATLSHARMTLDTDGTISTSGDFKPGADVIMNNGRGISFSSTGNGGNSATTQSELFDDYEEGAWTPQISDLSSNLATLSVANGSYTKIGRMVFLHYCVTLSSIGSMTGNYVFLKNIPYNHPTANYNGTGMIDYFTNLQNPVSSLAWDTSSTGAVFWLVGQIGTQAYSTTYISPSYFNGNEVLKGTIIYQTAV